MAVDAREKLDNNLMRSLAIPIEGSTVSGTISGISASSLGSGGLGRQVRIAKNGSIIINDGSNDRIVIGYLKDGF